VPCKTDHCTGTWTWTSAQQLAAGVRPVVKGDQDYEAQKAPQAAAEGAAATQPSAEAGEHEEAAAGAEATAGGAPAAAGGQAQPGQAQGKGRKGRNRNRKRRREPRPPERRCEACIEFLKDRKTHEIPCTRCATAIYWPPESQLQTHLGNWAEPSLCGACKRDSTEAARAAQREALRHPTLPGAPAAETPAAASEPAPDAPADASEGSADASSDGSADASSAHPPLHNQAEPESVSESPS